MSWYSFARLSYADCKWTEISFDMVGNGSPFIVAYGVFVFMIGASRMFSSPPVSVIVFFMDTTDLV